MQFELKVQGSRGELAGLLAVHQTLAEANTRRDIAASDSQEVEAALEAAARMRECLANFSGCSSDDGMLAWVEGTAKANEHGFDVIKAIAKTRGLDALRKRCPCCGLLMVVFYPMPDGGEGCVQCAQPTDSVIRAVLEARHAAAGRQ